MDLIFLNQEQKNIVQFSHQAHAIYEEHYLFFCQMFGLIPS